MSGNGAETGKGEDGIWGGALEGCMGGNQVRYQNRNQESALRIMEALSGVDTSLLERSEVVVRRKRPLWQYGSAWAAVVCAAAVGVLTWRSYQYMNGTDGNHFQSPSNSAGGAVQMSSSAVNGMEGEGKDGWETEFPTEDNSAIVENEMSSFDAAGNIGNSLSSDAADGTGSQGGSSPSVAPGGNGSQGGSSPSVAPGGNENQDKDEIADKEVCSVPLNTAEKLTEEEARNKEIFGEYIPTQVPEGYGFEAAYWYEEERKLSISWSRGLDSIQIFMEQAQDRDIVDINAPERYDERLYEIPYGETVPQEYWEDFQNPVFAWEDFCMEIIESRMRSYEDSGDTDTPRGNFGILFPDGVLMRFSGRGTVNQIWDMVQSLGL